MVHCYTFTNQDIAAGGRFQGNATVSVPLKTDCFYHHQEFFKKPFYVLLSIQGGGSLVVVFGSNALSSKRPPV